MKPSSASTMLIAMLTLIFSSCGNSPATGSSAATVMDSAVTKADTVSIKTAEVLYTTGGKTCNGYIAYDENKKGKLPIIVVVPEWWGLTEYPKSRARQLASLGYFAIAADLYGDGKTAATPQEAMAYTKPYYTNPALSLPAVKAAIAKASTFSQADSSMVAAIGYCFGGFIVLNAAKLGAPLKGVVSFHGDLGGLQPKKDLIKSDILICQGASDKFVPDQARTAFKKSMDSVGAHFSFIEYAGAMHAFTNPGATALGEKFKLPIAYNGPADTASWKDMQTFFLTVLK